MSEENAAVSEPEETSTVATEEKNDPQADWIKVPPDYFPCIKAEKEYIDLTAPIRYAHFYGLESGLSEIKGLAEEWRESDNPDIKACGDALRPITGQMDDVIERTEIFPPHCMKDWDYEYVPKRQVKRS